MPAPKDADLSMVARCKSLRMAFMVTLCARGAKFNQSWFAGKLGVTPTFISRIKSGEDALPEWMVPLLCALSGTNLLQQWIDLQDALNAKKKVRTERDEALAIANELRAA